MNISTLQITPETLTSISAIDEFKGAWKAYRQIAPEQLNSLKRVATIESIASSTRIEGSRLSDIEVEALLSNIQVKKFKTRDEQEVAGYAEVMNTTYEHYATIKLTENFIKQFHRDLLKHSEKDSRHRGEYKKHTNHVEAFDADGASIGIVFETATPFDTPYRMQSLIKWANEAIAKNLIHPLLITAVFVVELLAIHPFQDGNGRLSRILTTFLLLSFGYAYVPYSSLEAIIENSKEAYYLALRKTQVTIHSDNTDWQPWVSFFLKALLQQKNKLEQKIKKEKIVFETLPDLSGKIIEYAALHGKVTVKEIVAFTGANRNTVKKHMAVLVKQNHLSKAGVGKGTWYTPIIYSKKY